MRLPQTIVISALVIGSVALFALQSGSSSEVHAVRKRPAEATAAIPDPSAPSLAKAPAHGDQDRGARIAAEVDRAHALHVAEAAVNPGHPEHGRFASLSHLEEHAANLARFGLTEKEFIADCLLWSGELAAPGTEEPDPAWINPSGKVLSKTQQQQVQQEIEAYSRLVEEAARCSYSFLEFTTSVYAKSEMTRIPADAPSQGPSSDNSYFRCYTHVIAGDWKYIVDFRSSRYPELQTALGAVRELKGERTERVRNLIASF